LEGVARPGYVVGLQQNFLLGKENTFNLQRTLEGVVRPGLVVGLQYKKQTLKKNNYI
jgi:hypothetical protein